MPKKSERIEINMLYDLVTKSFNMILNESEYMGKIVTGLKINPGQMILYQGDTLTRKDEVERLVEANQDDIQVDRLDKFIDKFPKVQLVGTKEEKNRKCIVLMVDRKTYKDTDLDEDNQFQGFTLEYRKNIIYIDESEESMRDPRPYHMKMAEYQVPDIENYAIYKLMTSGYRKGFYVYDDSLVYGLDEETNENIYLGCLPEEVSTKTYRKCLEFESLAFPIKKMSYSSKMFFITIPNIEEMEVEPKLKNLLNKTSGVIALDSFNAYDLINSNIIKDRKSRQIWYTGNILPSKSRYNMVTTCSETIIDDKTISSLKYTGYNWILDDNNKLSVEQIIELSDNHLVIIGANLTDTIGYFRKFDQITQTVYDSFFNRVLYMGSMYKKVGIELNKLLRNMISDKNYSLFGSILQVSDKLEDTIFKLFINQTNCNEVRIKNNQIFLIVKDKATGRDKEMVIRGYDVENNDILKMVWRTQDDINSNENFLSQLEEKGSYTLSMIREDPRRKGFNIMLKAIIFKSGPDISVRIRPLIDASQNKMESVFKSSGIVSIIIGGRESGKTTKLKTISYHLTRDKKVYIYDPDHDFSKYEFLASTNIIIDRDNLNLELLKPYDPDIVIINSDISPEQFMYIFLSVSDRTSIYIGSTYNIVEGILTKKDIAYDNYKMENLLSRAYIYDLKTNQQVETDLHNDYLQLRLNEAYKYLNYKHIDNKRITNGYAKRGDVG